MGGVLACAVAISFAACSNSEFDGRTDTVYSLETPSVTAKAYPGVNIVSWKPVTGASSYKVSVYEEGAQKGNAWNVTTSNFTTDTDLKNGKNYTYYVEAVSTTNPATVEREVYATNSRGEASVKAIVPPDNTKSLELPAYESGYDGTNVKTVAENDEGVIKASNIKAFVDENTDKIVVEFPMKAYLKYTVKCYNNDLPLEINRPTYTSSEESDANANNVTGKVFSNVMGAGKHTIAVVAKAYGGYADSDEVVREELVTIEKLNVTQYDEVTAEYVLDDDKFATGADKKVRVSFKPAIQNDNGNKVPTDWYTVYRRVVGEYENTALDGKISVDEIGNYYIEDTVDVAKKYVYTVVLSHDGKYGEAEVSNTLSRGNEDATLDADITNLNSSLKAQYVSTDNKFVENADKRIRVSFAPATKDGDDLPTGGHKVYRMAEDEKVWTLLTAKVNVSDDTKSADAGGNNTVTYYVEDTVSVVTKSYKYKVVVTDGTKYKESNAVIAQKKDEPSIDGITAGAAFNPTDNKVTLDVTYYGAAKLSAKYLIVSSDRDTSNVPVLANEILEKGTTVNLGPVSVGGTVQAGKYTAAVANPTFTGSSAYIYFVVQAELDGHNTTNVITQQTELSN